MLSIIKHFDYQQDIFFDKIFLVHDKNINI